MIRFAQDGTKVRITIDPGMSDKKVSYAYLECSSDWFAELLVGRLQEKFNDTVRAIRSEEYRLGWKEAKSHKKAKRDWFPSFFGVR